MQENNHALTSITFSENGRERRIDIQHVIWAFEWEGALYLVDKNKKVYTFELESKDPELVFEALKQANPAIIFGAFEGSRIGFESLDNTRDLGGIQTMDGRFILPHKLLRSGSFHKISKADRHRLEQEFDVRLVMDLRTEVERLAAPDPIMLQAENVHVSPRKASSLDLLAKDTHAQNMLDLIRHAKKTMRCMYEELVVSEQGLKAYRRFFEHLLASEKGSVLWHCTQGKDRTGVGTMLLLSALGVSKERIYQDYLQTNVYLKGEKDALAVRLRAHPDLVGHLDDLYDAKKEYLDLAYQSIEQNFGTMENYLIEGLGLEKADIARLREKFLV